MKTGFLYLPVFLRVAGRPHLPAVASAVLIMTACVLQAQPQNATGQVDFSSPQTVHTAFGLLEGASSAGPSPANSGALQPGLWRLGMYRGADLGAVYQQAAQSRAMVHYVVSDRFCYPINQWCGIGPPFLNWPLYESMVGQAATQTLGMNVMFDVWNEPDNPQFWSGTQAQFFEAYLRAYRVLRAAAPTALIGGPSSAVAYNKTFLQAFLNFCVANGCQVNFLSWHELDDNDQNIAEISAHLLDARSSFVDNPAYASLHLQRIDINETTGPISKDYPAAILEYLSQLEQGGADGASRSCWANSQGNSTCFDGSLDGLLTANGWPRSSWWTYKIYSDGVNARVASTSSEARVPILGSASLSGAAAAQVLLGYYNLNAIETSSPAPMTVQVNLVGMDHLPFLTGAPTVHLRLEKMPASGESPLAQPVLVQESNVPWTGTSLTTTVSNIQSGEAYRITIRNPSALF